MRKISMTVTACIFSVAILSSCTKEKSKANQTVQNQNVKPAQTMSGAATEEYLLTDDDLAEYPFLSDVKNIDPIPASYDFSGVGTTELRFSFRWASNCASPLGACITIPIGRHRRHPHVPVPFEYALEAPVPTETGDGLADVYLLNDSTLAIFPDQDIYLSDFTVPISHDIDLYDDEASSLGKQSIKILKGRYQMQSNYKSPNYQKGYVLVSCVTE